MKKLIALAIVVVMLLSMIPMVTMAADEITLYLKPNSNWLQSNARFAVYYFNNSGNNWTNMTKTDDGYYQATVPAGYTYIFCRMNPNASANNWNNKWNQTSDLTLPSDGSNCYTVADGTWDKGGGTWSTYGSTNPNPGESETPETTYIVAGSKALLGSEWDSSDTNNKMTKGSSGLYELTLTNVPVNNDYQLKVASSSGDWYGDASGNNITFNVTSVCDVKISFNEETKEVTVTGSGVTFNSSLDVEFMAAVGNGKGQWLNGANWDPTAAANKMTESNGVYTITFQNVDAGSYEVKFAADGAWTHSFGGTFEKDGVASAAVYGGDNIKFDVTYAKADITLTLDMSNFDFSTKSGATYTIAIKEATSTGDSGDSGNTGNEGTGNEGGNTGNEGGNTGNEGGNTGDEGTTTPTGNLTIHAKVPSSWETAYLYAWASEPYVAWPGSEMTAADGWYTIEIPTSYSNIIVAEKNGGEQTVDLSLAGVTETEIWVTLGEKNSEGKYEASLAKNDKGDDVTIEQKPEEEKPAEVTEVTVYAKVPEDWKNPGVWAWAGDKNAFTSWPGLSMTQGENGWWYAKIPAWCANVIINANNGSYQTADLDITESQKDIWIEVTVDGNGQAQTQIKYTSPNTGDTAIIAPVVVLMVLSMAGIAVLLAGKKKFH